MASQKFYSSPKVLDFSKSSDQIYTYKRKYIPKLKVECKKPVKKYITSLHNQEVVISVYKYAYHYTREDIKELKALL